jgi:hypothetical protein
MSISQAKTDVQKTKKNNLAWLWCLKKLSLYAKEYYLWIFLHFFCRGSIRFPISLNRFQWMSVLVQSSLWGLGLPACHIVTYLSYLQTGSVVLRKWVLQFGFHASKHRISRNAEEVIQGTPSSQTLYCSLYMLPLIDLHTLMSHHKLLSRIQIIIFIGLLSYG